MRRRFLVWAAALVLAALLLPPAARAAPEGCTRQPVDLVLVLDDSGSMGRATEEQNDPDNLRITAAHLMADLLDPADRVGLVLFAHELRQVTPLTPAGAPALHEHIERFRTEGGTRLDLALEAGLNQLAQSAGRTRAVLFLTDGRPDTDPEGQRIRLLELAAKARSMDAALYVIGLGPNYDRELLEQVTTVSQSQQLWHVVQPEHLSTAFLEILRALKGLNIETATDGRVAVLGLSPEVRFAALRPGQGEPVTVEWPGGELVSRAAAPATAPGVLYGYDLITYKPRTQGPGTATAQAPVLWKIERPPVAARFLEPGARAEVDSGEALPVRLELAPCGGADLPAGLKATVQVLDADRKPTPYQAELTGSVASFTGDLPMPPEAGTFVLSARILTAEGRQVTVAEQTVTATPRSRWLLEA
ncbi:MAG TPA: vWA domain-containing protein, partial [Symbiobacteriaceae bacterium]|nr:vWA domain-containing protein [Symbiobacteriaceae bacterium]